MLRFDACDAPVQGGPGHAQIACDLGGWFAGCDEVAGVFYLAVGEPFPASAQVFAGGPAFALSVIRSRLISSSIWDRAAMTVNTMLPMGVPVSTVPPPRFSTRRSMRRVRSSSESPSMLAVERPSRSKVARPRGRALASRRTFNPALLPAGQEPDYRLNERFGEVWLRLEVAQVAFGRV